MIFSSIISTLKKGDHFENITNKPQEKSTYNWAYKCSFKIDCVFGEDATTLDAGVRCRNPGTISAHGLVSNRGILCVCVDVFMCVWQLRILWNLCCHMSKDTPPQLLTGYSLTFRLEVGGGIRVTRVPKLKIDLWVCKCWGSGHVLFWFSRQLREISSLRGVFILYMVLHCLEELHGHVYYLWLNGSVTHSNGILIKLLPPIYR